MSATTWASGLADATARTWWHISSIVMCRVVSWPSTTFAIESPTRIRSTPAAEAKRAPGSSYAVTITSGTAPFRRFRARIAGALRLTRRPLDARPHSRGGPGERRPTTFARGGGTNIRCTPRRRNTGPALRVARVSTVRRATSDRFHPRATSRQRRRSLRRVQRHYRPDRSHQFCVRDFWRREVVRGARHTRLVADDAGGDLREK